jgi:hypothetical protein
MWRLLRDQIGRSKWQILASILIAAIAALVGKVEPRQSPPTGDFGTLFVRLFITTFATFLTASMGYISSLGDRRYGHAKTVRILPLARHVQARGLSLGAALPGVIIGSLVCALVAVTHFAFDSRDSARNLFGIVMPTIVAGTLGSAMSVVMWSYLAVTSRLPEITRRTIGLVLFHQLWYLAWLGAAAQRGVLAREPMLIVLFAAALAFSGVWLSPRLWTYSPSKAHTSSTSGPVSFGRRNRWKSHLLETAFRAAGHAFALALLVNAGFLMAILVHPRAQRAFSFPFRLRWMVLVTYGIVWFWFSSWRQTLRTLRCLPISGTKLVVASIGGCVLIYLAGALAILTWLFVEPEQARRALGELPFIVLLALGSSLCVAGIALNVGRPMAVHQLFGFGFLVLPNAMFLPMALGGGTWLVGFTSRVWLWSYSPPVAILLMAIGALAISRGILRSTTPYRGTLMLDRQQ